MGFFEAVSHCWQNWANFYGRARRSEYWYWHLFVILFVIGAFAGSGILSAIVDPLIGEAFLFAFLLVCVFGLIIPSYAVMVRRLHDRDLTGWLALLAFVPYIGAPILVVLTVLPGTDGENRYGPDSRNPAPDIASVF